MLEAPPRKPRASKSALAELGSIPIGAIVGIITAIVGITAADVDAEQSTRPERARVVASFVKEGQYAGIDARLKVRIHLDSKREDEHCHAPRCATAGASR